MRIHEPLLLEVLFSMYLVSSCGKRLYWQNWCGDLQHREGRVDWARWGNTKGQTASCWFGYWENIHATADHRDHNSASNYSSIVTVTKRDHLSTIIKSG